MIIYLYGPDDYRRQEKLKEILAKYREKHSDLSVARFYLSEEEEFSRLKDFSTAQSLFDSSKFGILYDVNEIEPAAINPILELAAESKSLTLVISSVKKLPKEIKPLSKKDIKAQSFENLSPAGFLEFVKKEAADRKLNFNDNVLRAIAAGYAGNSWGLVTELDRLALGGAFDNPGSPYNFFGLIERARNRDLAALSILLEKEEPAMIFNMLAASARTPAAKSKMADYDAAIKSGKLEYPEALTDAILT
ncbi:MAG: hypothetical protein HYT03_02865 [Candidatus Harrisonbacteria bacterium]|nr:hypothetical protein [Candidatus Harrisonbacteria bacterium]